MKKLTREQKLRLKRIRGQLKDRMNDINAQIDMANRMIEDYNSLCVEFEEFRDEILGEMEEYIDQRSENWSHTDAGQAYISWYSDWTELDTDEADQLDEFTHGLVNAIDDLATSPKG